MRAHGEQIRNTSIGGLARTASLTKKQHQMSARRAAQARWNRPARGLGVSSEAIMARYGTQLAFAGNVTD